MKQFYFSLLLFIGCSFFIAAQEKEMGGTPVEGLTTFTISKESNNSSSKSSNMTTAMSEMQSMLATTTPTGNSTEVGTTEGQLSVSLSGGATYNIPITVPLGINGVVPQVSLVYNSQGGNGMAGYGWNIAGVSKITRIPATKFYDGTIDGVDFDNLDRFALDGQRLIAKSGTYGASGTVYETESFSNLKITSFGVHPSGSNYGPSYFLVEYPDGSKAYYGNSTDSRSIMEYSITYWENPQNVRISYTYNYTNNNLMIASINYGTVGSTTAINKVQFNYNTSNRPEVSYTGGQKITQDKILNNIVVTGNSVGFRSYWMTYDYNTLGYQRLTSITEKSGDGTKSYNPTVFSYSNTADSLIYSGNLTANVNITNVNNSNAASVSGDFYGSENMEFLLYPTIGTQTKSIYWLFPEISQGSSYNYGYQHNVGVFEEIFSVKWLTWNNKLFPKDGWAVAKKTDTNYSFTVYSFGSTYSIYEQYSRTVNFPTESIGVQVDPATCWVQKAPRIFPKKILSGDFNGDGLTDVIALDSGELQSLYNKEVIPPDCNNIGINKLTSKKVYFVDLKRDNTTNFLTYSGELSAVLSTNARLRVADFNGDGKSDFIVYEQDKATIYTLDNNNQLVLLWNLTEGNISVSPSDTRPMLLGDFNGDGKTDMIFPKNTGITDWFTFTSTGTGFIKTVSTFNNLPYNGSNSSTTYSYIASDYDKDGKTDIIQIKSTRNSANTLGSINITCYKNINNTFNKNNFSIISTPDQTDIYQNVMPVFLTPESIFQNKEKPYNPALEIACYTNNAIKYFHSEKDNVQDQLMRSVTTGNGVTESITYRPLNSSIDYDNGFYSPIYNSSLSENYPNFNIESASSMQVVSMLEKQSATDYKKQLYSYYDAISNTEGLGFLGFKSTANTNWFDDNNPVISTVSKFDTNLRGANIETYTVPGEYNASSYAAPGNFISKTTSTYTSSLSSAKVFKLQLSNSQQYNGLENTSTETSVVYDAYNNPTQTTVLVKEGGATQQTTTTNLTYAAPTSSPYIVGKPVNKTQSVVISGDTMTSEEQYTFNTGYLLTQVKKKGHNTNFVTEDNVYDTFGNITKKTISGTNFSPRETNYEYDSSGRFLTKSIDVEGLATSYSYNTANGVLNSETNPYGLTTSYLYDAWFKKTKTTDYLGKSNTYAYTRVSEKTKIITTGDDGSFSEELYDDLGRKITASVKDLNGNTSSVSYLYDIYDRNYKISEPYSGGSATQWNETQYDVYGRPIQNISFTGKTTSISYSGLTTTINDGTKTKTVTKNALGNTVSITDSPGGTISYTYFANGNLKSSNYDGVITTIEQNGWGRKTKLTDPSAGTYTYTYNDLGEALTETTPNGTTTYTLNAVGKLTQKTIVGTNTNSATTYTYDGTSKLLLSSTFTDVLENNATTTTVYTYDANKRVTSSVETTPYATFTKQLTYDGFSRVNTVTSTAAAAGKSSAKTVQHTYKNGQPWQIIDSSNSQILWQTNMVNARGQLTGASMANGNIAVTNTYDSYGFISQTKQDRMIVSPGNIMTLNTVFDPQKGNLSSRTNSLFNWSESFIYDSLDRLTSFKNTAGVTETQSYDDRGRITQNAVGTYNYTNSSKAYQNTSVTVTPAALAHYQVNHEQNITYNAFKSPYQIEEVGKDKISFTYNDNNSRSTMFYGSLDNNKLLRPLRKYYSADGSMEIKHNIQTGAVEFVTYIGGDGYTAPIVLKSDGTTQNYLYLQRDYQGSIVAISDATGQVLEKRLFDAWGNVLVKDGAGNSLAGLTILDRGYTGHEHLQSVGLIHMNGRLFDPKLHRFLQPDNYVQDPSNTQNYNRYGYVLNNPLKYIDPSGELSFKSIGKWFKRNANDIVAGLQIIGGTALTIFSGGTLAVVGAGMIGAGVTHFAAAYNEYKQTGDWSSASKNSGVFFNVSFSTDWGYNSDKKNGVNQNEPVVKPKTEVKGDNSSTNNVNWQGVADSSIGIVGGTAEIILGVAGEAFTGGLSTALIIDGGYRIGANSLRLISYVSGNNDIGNSLPSNIGGTIGKITDGMNGGSFIQVGKWQNRLGIANDISSFILSGGNGSAMYGLMSTQGAVKGSHLYSIFSNYYSVWNYANQKKK
ncbi:RHS repeat-associated core domain-containing protein [Flavobacterium daejeonense]|uniref:RHS repeat-associated core domain-containing protein n=1 Tax=Flavobacterium daejeonense TaxID=350893 RepID=UPI00047C5339|nr:RHS repeat-associated core domain-containing protein [Flavobacterium daejeonense]